MKNILTKFKINNYTYFFILLCFCSGYIKNILLIFFICLVHELGHVFFIKLFNYKVIQIELFPFGGFTKIDKKINSSINKDILISFGGILFQLIFILVLYLLKNYINIITFNLLIYYNIILILFNLLPIEPLDGSKIIHLILEKLFSFKKAYYINLLISILSLIIFIYFNYLYKLDNYIIISFLLYKIIINFKNYKYIKKRFILERYLYPFNYKKINNNTKNIDELKKEVFHYFKENNKYINECKKIEESILHTSHNIDK